MKKVLLLGIVPMLIMIHACKLSHLAGNLMPPPPDSTESVSTMIKDLILRDTVHLPADTTAWMQMLLECDSQGNVKVAEIFNQMGDRSRIMMKEYFQQDSIINQQDSLLKARRRLVIRTSCQCDSAAIYAEFHLRDTVVTKTIKVVKNYPVPVPIELTWWEKFKIEYGGYAFGVIAAVLGYYLIRLIIWAAATFTPQGAAIKTGTGLLSGVFRLFSKR